MTLQEAIRARHSVRTYLPKPLSSEVVAKLQSEIDKCNEEGHLHIQLVLNEPKAFQSRLAKYGKFSGVTNYLMMIGRKSNSLDERVGYYGERLVLLAQTLGLNTCWVGLSYQKIAEAFTLDNDEKVSCCIALGYGGTQGNGHRTKTVEKVSNASSETPNWFRSGVEAALLAPSSVNQQKYSFEYVAPLSGGIPKVKANRGFSIIGYTHLDLGIAKYHFEIGAGHNQFEWA